MDVPCIPLVDRVLRYSVSGARRGVVMGKYSNGPYLAQSSQLV
jgi:hypothetical protein